LLVDGEAAGLLGTVHRSIAIPSMGGYGVVFKGREGTLSLTVARGHIAGFNIERGRAAGVPLRGVGDEAWLTERPPSVVIRVGDHVAVLAARCRRVDGTQPLRALAAIVASRLASPPGPNPPAGHQ
jgi:hypothetical protein